jgi:hypothetical protein
MTWGILVLVKTGPIKLIWANLIKDYKELQSLVIIYQIFKYEMMFKGFIIFLVLVAPKRG